MSKSHDPWYQSAWDREVFGPEAEKAAKAKRVVKEGEK